MKRFLPLITGLVIFPNPVSETLNIICDNGSISKIQLIDVVGRLIQLPEYPAHAREFSISVKHIKPGIYFLEVISDSGSSVKVKIAVQH